MTPIKSGLAFHVHHDALIEYCRDYDERVRFIKKHKPRDEHALRLRLFKLIPKDRLPQLKLEAYAKAGEAYDKTGKARNKARNKAAEAYDKAAEAYDKAGEAYFKAREAYAKAGEGYFKTREAYRKANHEEIESLHKE